MLIEIKIKLWKVLPEDQGHQEIREFQEFLEEQALQDP